jgi:hypothetical protein
MALTVDQIRTSLDALYAALGSGQLSVTYYNRSVTFRSIDDLLLAIAKFEALLAAALSRPKQYLGYSRKGFSS